MKKYVSIVLIVFFSMSGIARQDEKIQRWHSDIDFLVKHIESIHPNPWYRVTRDDFLNAADKLKADIPGLKEEEIIVRAMQLVAILKDAHTSLTPYNHPQIPVWFPVRLEKFADGIFITAIDKQYEEFIGARVLQIGKLPAERCFELVGSVTSVDSRIGFERTVPVYISNATILKGLNIVETDQSLPLEVSLGDGGKAALVLPASRWPFDLGWINDRNIAPGGKDCITVFSSTMDKLPLHLKKILTTRDKYWFELLPEHRAIYFQFNSVSNDREPLNEFIKRLWDTYEKHSESIEKFIIDIRYNNGGEGTLLKPLLHEFIKHETINKRGKLFIIMGRNTFSAASNFVGQMIKHTEVLTVGEPASGPLNWCSDIERLLLPSGRLGLDISTMYWQEGHALDKRGYCPPEFPVLVNAADFFSGHDRALEAILDDRVITLSDILKSRGIEAFESEYKRWSEKFASHDWWFPYTVFDLRRMGVELFIDGRKEDAVSFFDFMTTLHPDVYWVWEILGNICVAVGDKDRGIECLEKALDLSPNDIYVRNTLNSLRRKN
jgi:tetratricopeptide (TPR) repeat protein